jgi:hypothetical protein
LLALFGLTACTPNFVEFRGNYDSSKSNEQTFDMDMAKCQMANGKQQAIWRSSEHTI